MNKNDTGYLQREIIKAIMTFLLEVSHTLGETMLRK